MLEVKLWIFIELIYFFDLLFLFLMSIIGNFLLYFFFIVCSYFDIFKKDIWEVRLKIIIVFWMWWNICGIKLVVGLNLWLLIFIRWRWIDLFWKCSCWKCFLEMMVFGIGILRNGLLGFRKWERSEVFLMLDLFKIKSLNLWLDWIDDVSLIFLIVGLLEIFFLVVLDNFSRVFIRLVVVGFLLGIFLRYL